MSMTTSRFGPRCSNLAYLESPGLRVLDAAQEHALARRVREGDQEARDLLVRANLRLVVPIARGFLGRGLPLEDLAAEGNLGLIHAAEAFDPDAGVRFSTYAAYWIRATTRAAVLKQGGTLRLPHYMATLLPKWRQAESELAAELGCEPTADQVRRRVGLTRRRMVVVLQALRALAAAPRQEDESDRGHGLSAAADHSPSAAEQAMQSEELSSVLARLGRLEPRIAELIRLRFGLESGVPQTLAEVGKRLGMTRERVRQLERSALGQLRN